jgi:hypothetical protein
MGSEKYCKHPGCTNKRYVTLEGNRWSYCYEHRQDFLQEAQIK